MTINSPRSPWQCLKSAWPYLLQFWRYRGKSGLGAFYPPPAAGIRVGSAAIAKMWTVLNYRSFRSWIGKHISNVWYLHRNKSFVQQNDHYIRYIKSRLTSSVAAVLYIGPSSVFRSTIFLPNRDYNHTTTLTLQRLLLPYGLSYKASCARPG